MTALELSERTHIHVLCSEKKKKKTAQPAKSAPAEYIALRVYSSFFILYWKVNSGRRAQHLQCLSNS